MAIFEFDQVRESKDDRIALLEAQLESARDLAAEYRLKYEEAERLLAIENEGRHWFKP